LFYFTQKRKRRKWTAPNNGKSCDSIPKAIAISVDLGLLPSDTVIPSGKKKKKRSAVGSAGKRGPAKKVKEVEAAASLLSMGVPPAAAATAPATTSSPHDEESSDEEDAGPPPIAMDPETTLDVNVPAGSITRKESTLPTTIHWDPTSTDGRKIGWKVKIENRNDGTWEEGRVVRYDPHTHKHKIEFSKNNSSCWIWLRNEQHNLQLATRMVWAHVKGYAWWPALVMEANAEAAKTKEGYVLIEFFGTGEISCLRDHCESVRPFDPTAVLDPIVAKHRKKRNQRAYQLACQEYNTIGATRNEAAVFYARAAVDMANYYAVAPTSKSGGSSSSNSNMALIGRRVRLHRSDVNYPYGDKVVGTVRQYSQQQKKWLITFELTDKHVKYPPA